MNYLFSKPHASNVPYGVMYDSDDETADEASDEVTDEAADDVYEDDGSDDGGADEARYDKEHLDPHSYSWTLMRLAIVVHVLRSMNQFVTLLGYDPTGQLQGHDQPKPAA